MGDVTNTTNTTNQGGRAIDRHEDAICAVLDLCAYGNDLSEDVCYDVALHAIAPEYSLSPERLDSLVRMWCAIGGVEVPA